MLTNDCVNDIDRFLKKDRQIKEYRKKLDLLKELVAKIQLCPLKIPMNLFLIDCSKINNWLVEEAKGLIDKILGKLITANQKFNRSICERFDKIVRTMTQQAQTPDECVELIEYLENAKFVECFQLKVG